MAERTIEEIQAELAALPPMSFSLSSRGGGEMIGGAEWQRRQRLQQELAAAQQTAKTQPLQEAIAAEAAQRTAERGEARAAVAPAAEAAAALPTEVMTGADVARQQAQQYAQLMGGAAGYTPSPFSGRQQAMAQSAMMSAQGQYAQIAPQIDLASRQANIAAQQARAAQMGVVGVGLAGALAQVPTTMSPYQAAMIAMQAGQQAGYGGGTTGGGTTTTVSGGGFKSTSKERQPYTGMWGSRTYF